MHKKIEQLVSKGFGRRKIAQKLGISEWRVRTELRALGTTNQKRSVGSFDGTLRNVTSKKVSKGRTRLKKAVILNDLHIPYHDPGAVALAVEYIRDTKPNTIVLNGDIVDFYTVSSYSKDPLRLNTIQDEINEAVSFLDLLRKENPRAEIFYIKGNHEDRLERFLLDKAPSLCSLNCLAIDELLELQANNISFVDKGIHLGDLEIVHGYVARKNPGASAKAYYEKSCSSILVGHVHRLNQTYFKNKFGQHCLVENGCLCGLDPDYAHDPNWQQGFATVHYSDSGFFEVELHHIKERKLSYKGESI